MISLARQLSASTLAYPPPAPQRPLYHELLHAKFIHLSQRPHHEHRRGGQRTENSSLFAMVSGASSRFNVGKAQLPEVFGYWRCHSLSSALHPVRMMITNNRLARLMYVKICQSPRRETQFSRQRQRPRNGLCNSMGRLQRQNACTNRRQFGAILTEPGNLRLRRTAWWGWEDSNLQPNDYRPL